MSDKMYVTRIKGEKVSSTRFHLYQDCPVVRDREDNEVIEISEREGELLGLKVCSQCIKRATGGPAIEALEGFFGEDWPTEVASEAATSENPRDMAWQLYDYLKERGFYIARRRSGDA